MDSLRVMTFNVVHEDLMNFAAPWATRRPIVTKTIRSAQPDIVCLQEVSVRQLAQLRTDLDEYDFIAGEASGATILPRWASAVTPVVRWILRSFYDVGELCPILLRRGAVSPSEHGTFRLAPPPGSPGNIRSGWYHTPHVVTWARVEDSSGNRVCTVYNTHLGLVPWTARRMAEELVGRLNRNWNGETQLLTGDFNALPSGSVIRSFLAERDGAPPAFHDAWAEASQQTGPGRTFHWGLGLPGPRLDYILLRPRCPVLNAATLSVREGWAFASDHAALAAQLAQLT